MIKLLGLAFSSSALTSLFNLFSLTLVFSKLDIESLDVWFLHRDFFENILKLFFISQIGYVVVSLFDRLLLNWRSLVFLLFSVLFFQLILILCFRFFGSELLVLFFGDSFFAGSFYLKFDFILVLFTLLIWLDNALSPVLVRFGFFRIVFGSNLFGSLVLFFLVHFWVDLSLFSAASFFFVSKLSSVLPKMFLVVRLAFISDSGSLHGCFILLFRDCFRYFPVNLLLVLNKVIYLFGVSFLSVGMFAIYSIFYRYYTAAQNLVTSFIFNISAKSLSGSNVQEGIKLALFWHLISSFIIMLFGFFVLIFFSSFNYRFFEFDFSFFWLFVLYSFLPDGFNLIHSRFAISASFQTADSRISLVQAILNIALLLPSMFFFDIEGLVYSTFFVIASISVFRFHHLVRVYSGLREVLLFYFVSLFSLVFGHFFIVLFFLDISHLLFPFLFSVLVVTSFFFSRRGSSRIK